MRRSYTSLLLAIALLFHAIGLVGMGVLHNRAILDATPLHLLLMSGLLLVSARADRRFYPWAAGVVIAGFVAEWIGVHTGYLFGTYRYGTVLGPRWQAIPLLIGLNWLLVVSGAASIAGGIGKLGLWQRAALAAVLTTCLDWIIEPVAVRLGYWSWQGGVIPLYNYVCWAGVSFLMALAWYRLRLRPNHFAVVLFLIQAVFFAALRLLLR